MSRDFGTDVTRMAMSTALALVLLVLVPAEALWRSWGDHPTLSQLQSYRLTIIKLLALLMALLGVVHTEGLGASDLGLGMQLGIGGSVGLGLSLIVVIGLWSAWLSTAKLQKIKEKPGNQFSPQGPRELQLFLFMVPLLGFGWEVLYRGFLLWWLVPRIGIPFAVICASLSYGLAHGWTNARESLPATASALAFTVGYALTGSLWWLIVIHIGLPLFAFAIHRRIDKAPTENAIRTRS